MSIVNIHVTGSLAPNADISFELLNKLLSPHLKELHSITITKEATSRCGEVGTEDIPNLTASFLRRTAMGLSPDADAKSV